VLLLNRGGMYVQTSSPAIHMVTAIGEHVIGYNTQARLI